MIGYSLYTGLVGVENLSVIAVIDIAALLFTFSIMSNVLVLIEDGKKVSVIEIVQNAFKTPAFPLRQDLYKASIKSFRPHTHKL